MADVASTGAARAQRFPLNFPLQFRSSGMLQWQKGRIVNISRTGILFQSDEMLPTNSALDIRISLPLKVTLLCQGSVVRFEDSLLAVRLHRYHLFRAGSLQAKARIATCSR